MKITHFKHMEDKIIFEVEKNHVINKIEIVRTDHGTSSTYIDEFTETWSDQEYKQLEAFIEGCSNIVHCFYH